MNEKGMFNNEDVRIRDLTYSVTCILEQLSGYPYQGKLDVLKAVHVLIDHLARYQLPRIETSNE